MTPADFAAIFDRHFDAVHAYLQRRIGRDLADELAAETFLIAFDTRARYDGIDARIDASSLRRELIDALTRVPRRGAGRPPAPCLG